jgi:hypothetical protein
VEAIAWWAIPIGATLLAVAWVSFVSRPKPPADPHDSVEDYRRFRSALGGTRDVPRDERPGGDGGAGHPGRGG